MGSTVADPGPKIAELKAVIIVNPNGIRMFEGISDHYNDVFPPELSGVIPQNMFYQTMHRINHFISNYFPGRLLCGCEGARGECFIQKEILLSILAGILDAENSDRYQPFRLRWYYVKRMNYVLNRMEYVIEITFFIKMYCQL